MTTILTPVEKLKAGAEFMIGATEYRFADSRAYAYASDSNSSVPLFYTLQLHYIFPDGVPVIQPDKPKEVRAVIERTAEDYLSVHCGYVTALCRCADFADRSVLKKEAE